MPSSASEDNGLALLTSKDLHIYSVGISTGGIAEMRMAELNPNCHIITTSIDIEGVKFAEKRLKEKGFQDRLEVKIEDISQPLNYENNHFDFIYARLVLHFLTKAKLENALQELHRVLKDGGKLFVVVRSTDCLECKSKDSTYDPITHLTTYHSKDGKAYSRYFHTTKSIQNYLLAVGFSIKHLKTYDEQLYVDFQRTQLSNQVDHLIEVFASK